MSTKLKKITALTAVTVLLLPCASAADLPWKGLPSMDGATAQRILIKTEGDGYSYYTYECDPFPDTGLMAGVTLDLNGDGIEEAVSVTMEDAEDAEVFLTVYTLTGEEWQKADAVQLYETDIPASVEAHDVFMKQQPDGKTYLFAEDWLHEDCIGDGAAWRFRAFSFDGEKLTAETDIRAEGTDLTGDLDSWASDEYYLTYRPELTEFVTELNKYDFNIKSVYWDDMICEQNSGVQVLCHLYSNHTVSDEDIYRFTMTGGSSLSGFFSTVTDCTLTGFTLSPAHRLSVWNNRNDYDVADADAMSYVIPDSNTRLLTEDELEGYDKDTLALIRNEILARHGYPFRKEKYRNYFESKDWYVRNENFSYSSLSNIEMKNVELIKKLEAY